MNAIFDEERQLWVADGDDMVEDGGEEVSIEERLDDIENALIELAEIIAGGE